MKKEESFSSKRLFVLWHCLTIRSATFCLVLVALDDVGHGPEIDANLPLGVLVQHVGKLHALLASKPNHDVFPGGGKRQRDKVGDKFEHKQALAEVVTRQAANLWKIRVGLIGWE